ncbi:MAG: sugar phosphate nucleotidyltransferase [Candidatus Zixiibacteriota bacterium]
MKGVILAGGSGVRLKPLTDVINKHLLPVYDRPMIHFPISALTGLGVKDLLIVTGERWLTDFSNALPGAPALGLRSLKYASQGNGVGIVAALRGAEDFAEGEPLAVILGDNIFESPPLAAFEEFRANPRGARVFLVEVDRPEAFGVATFKDGLIERIVEKPQRSESNLAVTGLYLYDQTVFERMNKLEPSSRGEYEITDLNNDYIADKQLQAHKLEGRWIDCGEFDSLLAAWKLIAEMESANPGATASRAGAEEARA